MPRHVLKLTPTHIRTERAYKPKRYRRSTGSVQDSPLHGCAAFFMLREYQQRSVVKVSYMKNLGSRSWAAHGDYLQREHAQNEHERGLGFNLQRNDIDLKLLLREWQRADDPHLFKIIVSPENGYKLNLQRHAKELMAQMEIDCGTKLEWAAVDHHNTDNPHVHIVVRGINEDGHELRLDSRYITHGIRERSQVLVTRDLGLRRDHELVRTRELQVERDYVTEIDRTLRYKADEEGTVSFKTRVPDNAMARGWRLQEIGRLKYLETYGLAEQVEPKIWKISHHLESTLHGIKLEHEMVNALDRHGIQHTFREELAPTFIADGSPLTGKVVGMGLERELYDQRYLILEGTDGKAHYLQATNNIVRQHDKGEFHRDDVITIQRNTFHKDGKQLTFLKVENELSLEMMQRALYSRLDDDVIRFVKQHGIAPKTLYTDTCFGHEYSQAMVKRFKELSRAELFYYHEINRRYTLSYDFEQRYDRLMDARDRFYEREKVRELQREQTKELSQQLTLHDRGQAKDHSLDKAHALKLKPTHSMEIQPDRQPQHEQTLSITKKLSPERKRSQGLEHAHTIESINDRLLAIKMNFERRKEIKRDRQKEPKREQQQEIARDISLEQTLSVERSQSRTPGRDQVKEQILDKSKSIEIKRDRQKEPKREQQQEIIRDISLEQILSVERSQSRAPGRDQIKEQILDKSKSIEIKRDRQKEPKREQQQEIARDISLEQTLSVKRSQSRTPGRDQVKEQILDKSKSIEIKRDRQKEPKREQQQEIARDIPLEQTLSVKRSQSRTPGRDQVKEQILDKSKSIEIKRDRQKEPKREQQQEIARDISLEQKLAVERSQSRTPGRDQVKEQILDKSKSIEIKRDRQKEPERDQQQEIARDISQKQELSHNRELKITPDHELNLAVKIENNRKRGRDIADERNFVPDQELTLSNKMALYLENKIDRQHNKEHKRDRAQELEKSLEIENDRDRAFDYVDEFLKEELELERKRSLEIDRSQ